MGKRNHFTVLLPLAVDRLFTYAGSGVKPGDIVNVPFRNKEIQGIVWEADTTKNYEGKVKEINQVYQALPLASLKFIDWVARYTMTPKGLLAKMVLMGFGKEQFLEQRSKKERATVIEKVDLSTEQHHAVQALINASESKQFSPFLLEGVTGSGKTEVYLEALASVLYAGAQALVLLPEIALTTQLIARFEERFGQKPLIWHSGITPKKRQEVWQQVIAGQPCVVVGARSALFLPFPNLRFIVVDEEHDSSYKQEDQVRYQARDMAVVRAQLSAIPIVLVSATPSLETLCNIQQGRYQKLYLANRHGNAVLPEIHVIDMCQESRGWIGAPLQKALAETLEAGQQALLFLNRRGYAPLTLCRGCGHRLMCPGCTAWLVAHKSSQKLHCHHCGFAQALPKACPSCQVEESWVPCGPGVERVHESVAQLFPSARIALLTSDTLSTPKQMREIFDRIHQRAVDIVIGTQILAKGHHFPFVTVVGVIDADLGLSGGDLRASERTFQLLHQVSGRAGRAHLKGHVYLQTYQPKHPVITALCQTNTMQFFEQEANSREAAQMPPFGRLAAIIISGLNAQDVELTARQLLQKAPRHQELMVLGPVPAPLSQLRGRYRWRLLLKATRNINIQAYLTDWLAQVTPQGSARIVIDIDPYSFL